MHKVPDASDDAPKFNVLQVICLNFAVLVAGVVLLRLCSLSWTASSLAVWLASGVLTVPIAFILTKPGARPALDKRQEDENFRLRQFSRWDEDAADEAWQSLAARKACLGKSQDGDRSRNLNR